MAYLNLTVVFEGSNLNYGEGFGNVLSLKKISSRGRNYSYISRQALRYDMVRIMNESFGMPLTDVNKEKGVVQFSTDAKIDRFPEIDLFGYYENGKEK
jgi:CRISPR-associated protein Cst2